MKIEHLGKTIDSKHFDGNVDKELVNYIRDNYYTENKEKALAQLKKVLLEHKSLNNDIYGYYFERVANDTVMGNDKYSINQALGSDEIIQLMHNRTFASEKIYKDTSKKENIIPNFKTSIRLGGKGFFRKPTQFPIKVMRELLEDYTEQGDLYYDPCCGWGMRMLVSAEKGLTYIGNDINHDLVVKLNELGQDIKTIKEFNFGIIEQGSEIFIPELENAVDFVFTSPPYFDLEIYNGSEGLKETSYQSWLNNFITPLLKNSQRYVKQGKYIAINIKNGQKNMLYDDTRDIGESIGLELVDERLLKQANRTHTTKKHGDSSEKIMVFKNNK